MLFKSNKHFSHIYVEKASLEDELTQTILNRFPRSEVIEMTDYQSVFGRSKQNFRVQKKSQNLILAKKKDNLIYNGNEFIQKSEDVDFYYNSLVLNCIYDCQYCYLQGMYSGANIVVFTNQSEFIAVAENQYKLSFESGKNFHLAISYDTDLLGLEPILGLSKKWIQWAKKKKGLLLEIRTKSTHKQILNEVTPNPQTVFAWTLSPSKVAEKYEWGTPSTEMRLRAIENALDKGWKVRLCIDPIIRVEAWKKQYEDLVEMISNRLPINDLYEIHLGVFRISRDLFRRMKTNSETDLLHYPYEHDTNVVSYIKEQRSEMVQFVSDQLQKAGYKKNFIIWT